MLRLALPSDAHFVAALLHEFNTEFETPTSGVEVLAARLDTLLARPDLVGVLAAAPDDADMIIGLAVVSLRPNVWEDGPVALLDELYVLPQSRNRGVGSRLLDEARQRASDSGATLIEINVDAPDVDARRFYERHGFTCIEPTTGDIALYYWGELP